MLRAVKKYNIALIPVQLEPTAKLDMPIWYHTGLVGAKNPGFNTAPVKCQRKHHKIRTVRDLLELIKCTNRSINEEHKPRKNCKCGSCRAMRSEGCKHPHKCRIYARKLLSKLGEEWDPLNLRNLEPEQATEGVLRNINHETSVLFSKEIQTGKSLWDSF